MLTFCCDVYHRDEKVGRLEIVEGKLIKNDVYTDNILIHPFPTTTNLMAMTRVLKDRVLCESRCDKFMLRKMGLDEYNVYNILRNTHGVNCSDFNWFKFDDDREDLSWDDVKIRG